MFSPPMLTLVPATSTVMAKLRSPLLPIAIVLVTPIMTVPIATSARGTVHMVVYFSPSPAVVIVQVTGSETIVLSVVS